MSQRQRSHSVSGPTAAAGEGGTREKTYFELQREELVSEIAMVRSLSLVLQYEYFSATNLTVVITELRARPSQHQQAEPLARGRHRRGK